MKKIYPKAIRKTDLDKHDYRIVLEITPENIETIRVLVNAGYYTDEINLEVGDFICTNKYKESFFFSKDLKMKNKDYPPKEVYVKNGNFIDIDSVKQKKVQEYSVYQIEKKDIELLKIIDVSHHNKKKVKCGNYILFGIPEFYSKVVCKEEFNENYQFINQYIKNQ